MNIEYELGNVLEGLCLTPTSRYSVSFTALSVCGVEVNDKVFLELRDSLVVGDSIKNGLSCYIERMMMDAFDRCGKSYALDSVNIVDVSKTNSF